MALGFYFDMTRCIGCRACQVACKDKNNLGVGVVLRNAQTYEVGTFPTVKMYNLSNTCNHCENPACVAACPTKAMHKAEDGTVSIFAVNKDMQEDMLVTVDLRAFDLKEVKEHIVLHHDDVKAVNTEEKPDNVAPITIKDGEIKDGVLTIRIPALSWNVIRLG